MPHQKTSKTLSFSVTLNESLTPEQRENIVFQLKRLLISYLPEVTVTESGDKVNISVKEVDKFTRLKLEDVRNKLTWNRQTDLEKEPGKESSKRYAETAFQPNCPFDGSFDVSPVGKDGFKCNECNQTWHNPGYDQQEVDDFAFPDLMKEQNDVNLDEGIDRKKKLEGLEFVQASSEFCPVCYDTLVKVGSFIHCAHCGYCDDLISNESPVDDDFQGRDMCPACGSDKVDEDDNGCNCYDCGNQWEPEMIKESIGGADDSLGNIQDHSIA